MKKKQKVIGINVVPVTRISDRYFSRNLHDGSSSRKDGRYKLTLIVCTHCMHFSADYEKSNEQIFSSPVPN